MMEIVWLLGIIVVISGVVIFIARLLETSHPKNKKRKRTRFGDSSFVVIDDGGTHLDVSSSCDGPGDVGCD